MKIGSNTAVFILFFGLALIEAFKENDWLSAGIFLLLGLVSLGADRFKKSS